jgi:hypothetical protein
MTQGWFVYYSGFIQWEGHDGKSIDGSSTRLQ